MKNARVYIETEKKKIPLVFNLNVMEEIQEKYGTLEKWGEITTGDGEPKVKDLKAGIMAMMNEAIDIENDDRAEKQPLLTVKQVGRIISRAGLENSAKTLNNAVIEATKEDSTKNA